MLATTRTSSQGTKLLLFVSDNSNILNTYWYTTKTLPTTTDSVHTLLFSSMGLHKKNDVDIHTHPYTTAACAAGVVTKTTDRDSVRYTYNGTRRVRQLALGCESN